MSDRSVVFKTKVYRLLCKIFNTYPEDNNVDAMVYKMKNAELCHFAWYSAIYNVEKLYSEVVTFKVETAIVNVAQGALRGRKCTSALGKAYYRFQGVPYAKPPVGPLRFKDPQPAEPWTGVKNALKEGHICPQFDMITGLTRGNEDCLVLNIFTPKLPEDGLIEELPVMVWIHGGGFQIGSGNAEVYGPDFLIDENVILVTLNYRLGVLGFLSTGTADAPGNAGLKDITMALKWIKQNISVFGGNADNVTIFGESAGGAAVHYQILSPTTKGLFKRAISQSGSALCPWALQRDAAAAAFRLGRTFGCESKDPKILVECLRKIPAKVLAKRQNSALSDQHKREILTFLFVPSVEPETYENAFITDTPLNLLRQGRFNDVPYITGVNQSEGIINLKPIMDKKPPAEEIDRDFERVIPWTLGLRPGSEESKQVAVKIKQFYFGDENFTKKTLTNYVDLTSDTNFIDATHRTTKYHSELGKSPVYNYYFTHEGHLGLFKKLINVNVPGPSHADELGYLFYIPIIGPNIDPKTADMKVVKKMVKLWTNFARHGNPTPDCDTDISVKWEQVKNSRKYYLEINNELELKEDIVKNRMKLWQDINKICNTS